MGTTFPLPSRPKGLHARSKCLFIIFALQQNGTLPRELVELIVCNFNNAFRDAISVHLKEFQLSCLERVDNPSKWPYKLIIDYDIQSYSHDELLAPLTTMKPWIGMQ